MDPAIQFLLQGMNMAFATELARYGKDIPQGLFLDIMIEKNTNFTSSFKTPQPQTGFNSEHWWKCSNHNNI